MRLSHFLDGQWIEGDEFQPLYNPATEEVIAQCPIEYLGGDSFLCFGRETGGKSLRSLPFGERAALLKNVADALYAKREDLLSVSVVNGGNTRSDAKADVDGAIFVLNSYSTLSPPHPLFADGQSVQLGRTPHFVGRHIMVPRAGIALLINAFNFPCWGMAQKMACALLAGMPVVVKPATSTALIAWTMAKIVAEILPEGSFQFLLGDASNFLDPLDDRDCIAFTGSNNTVETLKRGLPGLNTRLNVETDSVNAAILSPDTTTLSATYRQFIALTVHEMTQKAGQKCTATRRVFVPEGMMENVISDLGEQLGKVRVGNPADQGVGMGPLASKEQMDAVTSGVEHLAKEGEIVYGKGGRTQERGFFVSPVVIQGDPSTNSSFHGTEVFGPVTTVMPYDGSAEQAAEFANRGYGSLVVSLFANDLDWISTVVHGVAPYHGRVWICSDKTADHVIPPGIPHPMLIHGGPGLAGGGAELGGLRGLEFYMQRVALQGYFGVIEHLIRG